MELTLQHYKTFSLNFVRSYVITMRPYLMFVSGITGVAGMSCAPELSIEKGSMIFLASFLSYGFGQALTDCFQIDTDSLSSPYRPLTFGAITKKQVATVSLVGLVGCVAIFSYYNPMNFCLGIIAAVGLTTYTTFKRRWWGGPFYNAWIVVVLGIMSYLAGSSSLNFLPTSLLWVSCAILFGYANFVLSGYFKDIAADKATGYHTLSVVLGRRFSAVVSDVFAAAFIIFATIVLGFNLIEHNDDTGNALSLLFFICGIVASVVGQIRLHYVTTDEEAHAAITPVVHCYILILSGVASFQHPNWAIPLLLFYFGFVSVLKLRPARNQI